MSYNEIGDLSIHQFDNLLAQIPEIEKLFSGSSSSGPKQLTNKELIEEARKYGLPVPKGS